MENGSGVPEVENRQILQNDATFNPSVKDTFCLGSLRYPQACCTVGREHSFHKGGRVKRTEIFNLLADPDKFDRDAQGVFDI